MVVKGNPKRLIIGLWVLSALLILWYNATAMTSLIDKPLPGLSSEARATIAKWQRLEDAIALRLKGIVDLQEIEKIFARIDLKKAKVVLPAKNSEPTPKIVRKPEPIIKKKVELPSLSGIVTIYGTDGDMVYLAVIDGKTREEKSSIGDFVLKRIDSKGILLAQGKESWFVPAPTVDFSVDKSMEE
ncbi:MAG: hypothetical protein QNK29_02730 [Desulfobacterales bacterium]|nr:hypothetical protein [Desulfobacterales bacterium]MDX2510922.1 hypothetical protein [Desulfobacterales bacterium]